MRPGPARWRLCVLGWGMLGTIGFLTGVVRAAEGNASAAAPFGQPVADDRVYAHGLLDEFEGRFGGGSDNSLRWDGEAWVGTDANRLWLKSEGFAVHGRVEDGDHEVLYARPIGAYFDLQAGLRYDLDSAAGRGWAAVGVEGLAPNFFQLSATLYASDAGHFAGKLLLSYEELLTQRLILEPLVELNGYTRPDATRGVGAGFPDVDAGVRVRYEISRKFAPYLGAVYEYARAPGTSSRTGEVGRASGWRVAAGVRAWF